MKRSIILIFLILFALSGCNKSSTSSSSGTVTLDNTLKGNDQTGYYEMGFLFSKGEKVSTLATPAPDISVFVIADTPPNILTFQAANYNPSFYKVGDYPDASAAVSAFIDLKTVGNYTYSEMADHISANQIWIYKSGVPTYAKIRIISVVNETRNSIPYGEVTFEWVFQPDGSTTFPAK
jgi:hypothetical protein